MLAIAHHRFLCITNYFWVRYTGGGWISLLYDFLFTYFVVIGGHLFTTLVRAQLALLYFFCHIFIRLRDNGVLEEERDKKD